MTEEQIKQLCKIITESSPNWDEKTKEDIKILIDTSKNAKEMFLKILVYFNIHQQ